ncbi:MAG: alpha/beta hydrolase [Betaproteobacteria bacterium]|jgi:3-oxoadipate enol-lactonase|nr:alpha/beta hydrolase [Betaproteobacteria bacterium]
MKDGFVQSASHGCIHYVEAGSGKPLVLLHSNGASALQYRFTMEEFAKTWRVIAMDMPGHGDSDPITRHYSIEMYAESVVQLLDCLKIDHAAVAGDSVGGSICIALARDHAHRTQPVVISECPLRNEKDWLNTWPRIEASYSEPTQSMDEVKSRLREATPEILARWNIDRRKAGAWAMIDVMRAMREFDAIGALKQFKGPATVIIGAKGNALNNRAVYEEAVGKNNVAVLDGCGHFPMLDDPALFVKEVNRLIAGAAK